MNGNNFTYLSQELDLFPFWLLYRSEIGKKTTYRKHL